MKILVDTNIVLDIFLNRPDFVEDSQAALEKALTNGDRLFFSTSSVTDVYYIVRKNTGDRKKALEAIQELCALFTFAEVNSDCIYSATLSNINDFEDAVIDSVGTSIKADYLMTRNVNDFKNAKNRIITPDDYIYQKVRG